jgi:hypothetical protein
VSRQKGSVAEREVAAIIEPWWNVVEPGKFVRTPLSGGWGTADTRAGFRASGDLMTTAPRFPFTVEVKRRESWTLERLLLGRPSPVWEWWRQAQKQGEESNLVPLLWFRKSRQPWRVMLPYEYALERFPRGMRYTTWLEVEEVDKINYGTVPAMLLADNLLELEGKRFL